MYIIVWTDHVNGEYKDYWATSETLGEAQHKYDVVLQTNPNLYTASICKPIQSTDYGV